MSNRVTIKDIARELNVHHSTVSRALRGDKRVSGETRKRISEFAKEQGYQVNLSALQLRGSARNVIAIIVPNISHQFFSNIISQITDLASNEGYVVSIFQSNESLKKEQDIIETILQNNVAGVIASVSMETNDDSHFKELIKYKIPLVLFDRVCNLNVPKVVMNNHEVIEDAVNLLVSKGFERIVHVSSSAQLNVFKDRQAGYRQSIKANHLDYCKVYSVDHFTIDKGREIANDLFNSELKPDAVICDSYNLLLGIISRLNEIGKEIPNDVGLIGFGQNASMEVIKPNITAIVQPTEDVAFWSFKLLSNRINEEDNNKNENIVLDAKVVLRDSC